jgi:hypothetical protein
MLGGRESSCYSRRQIRSSVRMSSKQVLVIEDDASIRRGLVDALTFSGYEVLQSTKAAHSTATSAW